MEQELQIYNSHPGTVRISGKTPPKAAACCAFSYLQNGVDPIDFQYIGGNAGQQAMKSMTILAHIIENEMKNAQVAFRPLRFLTQTKDAITGEEKSKDCTV